MFTPNLRDVGNMYLVELIRLVGQAPGGTLIHCGACGHRRTSRASERCQHGHVYPPGYAHVVPEALNGVLDVWDAHAGGVQGWFEAAGGDGSDVEALRRTLLV